MSRRFCLVGSGSDGLRDENVCLQILQLVVNTSKPHCEVNVVYIGTATYDKEANRNTQMMQFDARGCRTSEIRVSEWLSDAAQDDAARKCEEADIIVVSGGNTLFAVDCWKACGLDEMMRKAMNRGCVMAGGSAGAICWFDSGHSDSNDPATFKDYFLAESVFQSDNMPSQDWKYIRVPALGFLSGLCCPHFDKTQSNGVLRAVDFDAMMLRHPGEIGIGIDHFCALLIKGDEYSVFPIPGKVGSAKVDGSPHGTFAPNEGVPGVWKKEVIDGSIVTRLVDSHGPLTSLIGPAKNFVQDMAVFDCRSHNPIYSHLTSKTRPKPVKATEVVASLTELWSPRVVAEMDDYFVKVAKVLGNFTWHAHEHEDELFHILKGKLRIELESGPVDLSAGDVFVVPKGMKHNPIALEECHVMLVEKKSTQHTGDVVTTQTRSVAEQLREI